MELVGVLGKAFGHYVKVAVYEVDASKLNED